MQTTQTTQVGRRWRRRWLGLSLLPLALLSGCESAGGTGALAGGAGGAVLGNVIGKATGTSRTAGTLLGGAIGTVAGAVIGNGVDRDRARKDAVVQAAASVQAQQAGLEEVASLARSGVTDDVIVTKIRTSPVIYSLSSDQILWLKQNSVSNVVVNELQATAARIPQQVYVAQPAPQPSFGVGVGFGGR